MRSPERMRPPGEGGPGKRMGSGNSGNHSTTPPADLLLPRLDRVRETAPGQWIASCPGPLHEHGDRNPSLSIKQVDDRLLIHCFGGCHTGDVLAALGLTLGDLFDRPVAHHKPAASRYQRKRHGQAVEALRALLHECRVVWCAAEQMRAGYALDPAELERLELAMNRVSNAERLAA